MVWVQTMWRLTDSISCREERNFACWWIVRVSRGQEEIWKEWNVKQKRGTPAWRLQIEHITTTRQAVVRYAFSTTHLYVFAKVWHCKSLDHPFCLHGFPSIYGHIFSHPGIPYFPSHWDPVVYGISSDWFGRRGIFRWIGGPWFLLVRFGKICL